MRVLRNLPHDTDADLNGTPYGDVVELPAGIGGLGEVNQGRETNDTDDSNKSTNAKHERDANLLLPVHLQVPELPERYAENPEV